MKGFQMLVYEFLKENKELTVMVVRKYNFSQTDIDLLCFFRMFM